LETKKQGILSTVFNYFIVVSLVTMVVLVFTNAFLRYIFDSSIPASEELSRFLFIWVSFLGAIAAFKDKKHVGVDFLVDKFKGTPKLVIELTGNVIMLLILGVIFFGGIEFFRITAESRSVATGIPFGFISISIVITSVSMAGIILAEMVKRLMIKTRRRH